MSRRANPNELDRAAGRIQRGAAEIGHVRRALLSAARRQSWEGTAAESFRDEMRSVARRVAEAVRELEAMADDLRIGATHLRGERVGQPRHELVIESDPKPTPLVGEWVGQARPAATLGDSILHPRATP
jgi:WXG100 family type VII secretion target